MSLRKLFNFPKPSHFREDVHDHALPSREFSPELGPEEYCWEDYYADLKREYPIRYFFAETLADFLRFNVINPVKRPIKDAWYWLKCHVVPKHRYHMLDLRQPSGWQYGWLDIDHRMLYANFNLLNEFVKHEMPNMYCPTLEECEDEYCGAANKAQRDAYFEIQALHKWWNVERKEDEKKCQELVDVWHDRKYKQKIFDEETDRLFKEHLDADKAALDKETEMLIRLIKVRKSLWT